MWLEVYQLKKADSDAVIEILKNSFSRYGIPQKIVTDNGSQHKSQQFRAFTCDWRIYYTFRIPGYPRLNDMAESTVKIVKKAI